MEEDVKSGYEEGESESSDESSDESADGEEIAELEDKLLGIKRKRGDSETTGNKRHKPSLWAHCVYDAPATKIQSLVRRFFVRKSRFKDPPCLWKETIPEYIQKDYLAHLGVHNREDKLMPPPARPGTPAPWKKAAPHTPPSSAPAQAEPAVPLTGAFEPCPDVARGFLLPKTEAAAGTMGDMTLQGSYDDHGIVYETIPEYMAAIMIQSAARRFLARKTEAARKAQVEAGAMEAAAPAPAQVEAGAMEEAAAPAPAQVEAGAEAGAMEAAAPMSKADLRAARRASRHRLRATVAKLKITTRTTYNKKVQPLVVAVGEAAKEHSANLEHATKSRRLTQRKEALCYNNLVKKLERAREAQELHIKRLQEQHKNNKTAEIKRMNRAFSMALKNCRAQYVKGQQALLQRLAARQYE